MLKDEKQDFEIKLNLPWPPSVNQLYLKSSKGVYIAPKARLYYKSASGLISHQLQTRLHARNTIKDYVQLKINAYPPDRRRRDDDNIMKVLSDVLVRCAILKDDSLIRKRITEMFLFNKEDKMRGVDIIITPYVDTRE